MTLMQRPGTRVAMLAAAGIRFAAALAAVAFTLAACGGGGGSARPTTQMPPQPQPQPQPTPAPAPAAVNPFQTKGSEIAFGCCYYVDGNLENPDYERIPAGLTLENIFALPGVRYNQFELEGDPTWTISGIPVYTDTAAFTDGSNQIDTIAYRLVLDHGEILLATSLPRPVAPNSRLDHGYMYFGTPTPAGSSLSTIVGTWSGLSIGQERLAALSDRLPSSSVSEPRLRTHKLGVARVWVA